MENNIGSHTINLNQQITGKCVYLNYAGHLLIRGNIVHYLHARPISKSFLKSPGQEHSEQVYGSFLWKNVFRMFKFQGGVALKYSSNHSNPYYLLLYFCNFKPTMHYAAVSFCNLQEKVLLRKLIVFFWGKSLIKKDYTSSININYKFFEMEKRIFQN